MKKSAINNTSENLIIAISFIRPTVLGGMPSARKRLLAITSDAGATQALISDNEESLRL